MQKSFPLFLSQLHTNPDAIKESEILKSLTQDDFEELKSLALLKKGSDSTHTTCESCNDPHPLVIRYDGKNPYAACIKDVLPNTLESSEVRRWEFNVPGFLQWLTAKLGINEQIEALELDGLWHLGILTRDNVLHTCYFYCGRRFEEVANFLKQLRVSYERQILLTSKRCVFTNPKEHGIFPVEVGLLAELKGGSLRFNKKVFDQHLNTLRGVQFDLNSGNLSVNGESIVTIPLNTPQYHFAGFLWEKFSEPQANSKIAAYVGKKRNQKYDRDPNQMCYDFKNKIKSVVKGDERKQKIIDEIFVTSSTKDSQNGFMMQNST